MVAVRIVEPGFAETDLHVGDADVIGRAADDGSILRADGDGAGVADRVAEEVGRQLIFVGHPSGFAERCEGSLEFGSHGV